jgi:hypothetical protein
MSRFLGAVCLTFLVCGLGGPARAEGDKDTSAVLDKAIKALGGEEKLKAVKAATWKTKGTINVGGGDGELTSTATVQGLDHFRQEFDADINGQKVKGAMVVDGDKGWRKFAGMGGDLDKDALTALKQGVYLQVVPMLVLPLKGKEFKVKAAGEDKVNDKPAVVLQATGPDGKELKIYFDKESGLPVRTVAKVIGFDGNEVTQETTYSEFKEFGGIKKATKVEGKRGGEKFLSQELTEFKVLDKVDPKTFTEPE